MIHIQASFVASFGVTIATKAASGVANLGHDNLLIKAFTCWKQSWWHDSGESKDNLVKVNENETQSTIEIDKKQKTLSKQPKQFLMRAIQREENEWVHSWQSSN